MFHSRNNLLQVWGDDKKYPFYVVSANVIKAMAVIANYDRFEKERQRLQVSIHVDFNTFNSACMTWIIHHKQTNIRTHVSRQREGGVRKRRKEKSRSGGDSSSF